MIRRLQFRSQEGFALVSAVALMAVMLTLGLATFALVDGGTKQTRQQRELESSLNLAEGVLYSQAVALARNWPDGPTRASYRERCLSTTPTTDALAYQCPHPATLSASDGGGTAASAAAFRSPDFLKDGSWISKVRDDYGALEGGYNPDLADGPLTGASGTCGAAATGTTAAVPCTRDFDHDRQLWVQARTVVRGKVRNIVALLKLEELAEDVPRAAVSAGALTVTNQNNNPRPTVQGNDGGVFVSCNTNNPFCADYRVNAQTGASEVTPKPVTDHGRKPLMTAEQLSRMKERARTDNTYYEGCPPSGANLVGKVVWVEGCKLGFKGSSSMPSSTCEPAGAPPVPEGMSKTTSCINDITKPGVLIWHCGSANFTGNLAYVGLLYMVNASDETSAAEADKCSKTVGVNQIGNGTCPKNASDQTDVLEVGGGFTIWGAVAIDGPGCFRAGSNGLNVWYDSNVFGAVRSYGTAGLVQNTWRELPSNAKF